MILQNIYSFLVDARAAPARERVWAAASCGCAGVGQGRTAEAPSVCPAKQGERELANSPSRAEGRAWLSA